MADRPRKSLRRGRIVVLHSNDERDACPWEVWVGWDLVNFFVTHAEAITAAQRLAHD